MGIVGSFNKDKDTGTVCHRLPPFGPQHKMPHVPKRQRVEQSSTVVIDPQELTQLKCIARVDRLSANGCRLMRDELPIYTALRAPFPSASEQASDRLSSLNDFFLCKEMEMDTQTDAKGVPVVGKKKNLFFLTTVSRIECTSDNYTCR